MAEGAEEEGEGDKEKKVEQEVEDPQTQRKTSSNMLMVESSFERLPRRSSFRSKERKELTR